MTMSSIVNRTRQARAGIVGLLALLLMLLCCPSFAEDTSSGPNNRLRDRPPPLDEPTVVRAQLFLLDITNIDDADTRFDVDVFVELSWFDPRLAIPVELRDSRRRQFALEDVWTPSEAVLNDRGLVPRLADIVEVDDAGNVLLKQRYFGSLHAKMAFQQFPFDRQVLPIDLISYDYSPEEISYSSDSRLIFENESPGAAGWKFTVLPTEASAYSVPGRDELRPMIRFQVLAERKALFYLLTVFLPMSLIVIMAWSVSTLPPDLYPSRIGIATTAIFSVVAMGFTVRLGLPPIAYLTKADVYLAGSTLVVFSRLGFLVVETRLSKASEDERAHKLSSMANRAYLLGAAAVLVTTVLM